MSLFSKGKTRSKEKKEHAVSKSLTKWAATLVIGLLVWVGLTAAQAYVLTDKDVSAVVCAKTDIESGTIIDKDNVKDYFTEEAVNSALVTASTVTSMDDVTGRLITDMSAGEILSSTRLTDTSSINSKIKDPVEVSFAVNSADEAVNGYIRGGDVVDIYVATRDENDPSSQIENTLLIQNAYIVSSYDSGYAEIQSNDKSTTALYFVIEMERTDAAEFYNSIGSNEVTMVRVKDVK